MKLSFIPKGIPAYALFVLSILFFSCDKKSDSLGKIGDLDGMLTVKVLGSSEYSAAEIAKLASTKPVISTEDEDEVVTEIVEHPAFDVQTSFSKNSLNKSNLPLLGQVGLPNFAKGSLFAAKMEQNVKYRLVLYTEDDQLFEDQILKAGEDAKIVVNNGATYKWYAYSHNTEDDPVAFGSDGTIDIPEGVDFLYASGTIDIPEESEENHTLDITFAHKLARVQVEVNTMGMFADIEDATISIDGWSPQTAKINLFNGNLSDQTDYALEFEFSDFTVIEPPYKDRVQFTIYTAGSPSGNLDLKITDLKLKIDDESIRDFEPLLSSTPMTFSFSNMNLEPGKSYTALANLIESPLELEGVRWARQNLYYKGGHNPYRFYHTYAHHENDQRQFFSFRAEQPNIYAGRDSEGDPCALVYPEGTWKTPKNSDFNNSINKRERQGLDLNARKYPQTNGTLDGKGYAEYPQTNGTAAPYPGDNLRFNMNGYGFEIGVIENLITLNFGQQGSQGYYWSHDKILEIPLVAGLGSNYFSVRNSGNSMSTIILGLDLIGIDILKFNFHNVRCIRAN
ncbi:MAG TPA: fimbrillin family protein [Candidatus Sphingobacterium stercoripullorum]|nr:fimbrillin family protein [Candidatus Sphingobacterium stercoripullorum]